jgi:hypothetical protein
VKRHTPGVVLCGKAASNNVVSAPSPVRCATMVVAAAPPTASPRRLARPSGISASAAA